MDFKSYIVFYRTHLGSCGNLIEKLLEYRKPENSTIKIQSDLSETNYPAEKKEILQKNDTNNPSNVIEQEKQNKKVPKFVIEIFGCLPHARRPFFKYKDLDPELCNKILEEFQMIAVTEGMFKELVYEDEFIFYTRLSQEMPRLKKISELCQKILAKWPPTSELGKAANYFINNYPIITKYIYHSEISSTNNVAERALRGEKLMLSSSKFRSSEKGRVIYDINRTMVATCNAAGAPVKEYSAHIMKHTDEVKKNPQNFTPYAYVKMMQKIETP